MPCGLRISNTWGNDEAQRDVVGWIDLHKTGLGIQLGKGMPRLQLKTVCVYHLLC